MALDAVIVRGPLLPALRNVLLAQAEWRDGVRLQDHFAAFASPHGLARAARLSDLPLILFLARAVLRLDWGPLLHQAQAGLGREALVREVERRVRQRAAATIRRQRAGLLLAAGVGLAVALAAARLLR